jgi:hypothetical protein
MDRRVKSELDEEELIPKHLAPTVLIFRLSIVRKLFNDSATTEKFTWRRIN